MGAALTPVRLQVDGLRRSAGMRQKIKKQIFPLGLPGRSFLSVVLLLIESLLGS